jgi:uncharacterized coiled-coil DUF342 family protein
MTMDKKRTPDQARLDAVISQRNTALNAVAEHEALITVLSQQLDEKTQELEAVTKERDELKAQFIPAPPQENEHGPA